MKTNEAMSADVEAVEAGAPVKRKRRKWEAVSQASVNLGEAEAEDAEGLLAGGELYTVESICRAMGLRSIRAGGMRKESRGVRMGGLICPGEGVFRPATGGVCA